MENKEQLLAFMNEIDPALVEEVELNGRKRRMSAPLRAGLVAACVCLVLLGTAAAGVVSGWLRVNGIDYSPFTYANGGKNSFATVKITSDGTVYIPLDQFSQEAQDVPRSSTYLPQYRSFDSWDRAEEFLGIEIANNPVLDQLEPISQSIEDSIYGTKLDDIGCSVTFSGRTEAPGICLGTMYPLETDDGVTFRLIINAFITTRPLESGEKNSDMIFDGCQMPAVEDYVTPTGLQATIAVAGRGFEPGHGGAVCQTVFQLNGAHFTLFTFYTGDDPNQIVNAMKEILDAYS